MKRIYKYLVITGLNAVVCLFLAIPAVAQHGGGHGGGGGGGHFGGGGGGGARFSGGASGGRAISSSRGFGGTARVGVASRGGYQRAGFGSNARAYGGRVAYGRGAYGHGAYGHGVYGHGGWGGAYAWGRHGGYFYSHGWFGLYYYPFLGFTCGFLPYGYYPFYWDDAAYYYSGGLYYQYNNDQYTVVEPPLGASIQSIPAGAKSIIINGQQYYELKGVYYLPVKRDDGTIEYQIAGKDGELNTTPGGGTSVIPKVGDIVTTLPPDCKKVQLNGTTFFVSVDGIYYQEATDANNNKVYKIVGLDADQGN